MAITSTTGAAPCVAYPNTTLASRTSINHASLCGEVWASLRRNPPKQAKRCTGGAKARYQKNASWSGCSTKHSSGRRRCQPSGPCAGRLPIRCRSRPGSSVAQDDGCLTSRAARRCTARGVRRKKPQRLVPQGAGWDSPGDDPNDTPKHHDLRLQTAVISVDALSKAIDSTESEALRRI